MGNSSSGSGLAKKILLRIDKEEHRRLFLHTIAFSAVLLGSIVLAVYGADAMASDAARSGFFAFVSLLFSDFSVAMASFSDFAFSLIESFPVFSTVLLLSGVFSAIWSAANIIKETISLRRHTFRILS